jgi:Ca2+/H+ antiporter, TMEM165/GDT1 family
MTILVCRNVSFAPQQWMRIVMLVGTLLVMTPIAHVTSEDPPPRRSHVPDATTVPPAVARDVFDLLDQNHDGRMDRVEFQQAVDQFEDFLRHNPNNNNNNNANNKNRNLAPLFHRDLSFWNGFTSAVAMIVATEIGDKTFFIAAVLSMKNDRRAVFGGAICALILMTILSTLMGLVLPQFLDRKYTHLLAGFLFGYFGLRLLYEAHGMAANKVSEELEEVEEELLHTKKKNKKNEECGTNTSMDESSVGGEETEGDNNNNNKAVDLENPMRNRSVSSSADNNNNKTAMKKQPARRHTAHRRQSWHMVLLQAFTLTFVAEWGDRSQIATIALAAAKHPIGVTIGGCLGHAFCTGMAVLGGRMLAARISEKIVHQWGGILFLCFGIHSLFFES